MRTLSKLVAMGIALPFAVVSADAAAPEVGLSGSYTINIRGFVPVICRANLQASSVAATGGAQQLGSLNEFCNNASGYRVVADYSPSLAGGSLLVDGRAISLTGEGSVVVSQTDHAGIASRQVALDVPAGTDGSISFRVETF